MAAYKLYHMDYPVMSFRIDRRDVLDAKIDKQNSEHLPIALKRILRYAAEFIAEETPGQYVLSDEGNVMVDDWLSNRQIPADRDAYQKYVKNPSHVRAWMLENHAAAFTDQYWIANPELEPGLTWKDVQIQLIDYGFRFAGGI